MQCPTPFTPSVFNGTPPPAPRRHQPQEPTPQREYGGSVPSPPSHLCCLTRYHSGSCTCEANERLDQIQVRRILNFF